MYIKNPPYVDKNRDEVRATPIENIVAAKELLEHNKSPAALETAVKLMTKALVQQEKATSSRWLESDAALCRSSTASKAQGNGNYGTHHDNESHIRSSEVQRREACNQADAIPISSDDKLHGKGTQRTPSKPGLTCKLRSPKTSKGLTRDPITLVTSKGADELTMRPPKLSLLDG
jgi:hypothetical protein